MIPPRLVAGQGMLLRSEFGNSGKFTRDRTCRRKISLRIFWEAEVEYLFG